MKDLKQYIERAPGRERFPGGAFHRLYIAPDEGQFSHHGATTFAKVEGGITLLDLNTWNYNNAGLTETKTNASTIAVTAAGLRFQTAAGGTVADGDNIEIVTLRAFTPKAGPVGKRLCSLMSSRLQVSSAANLGFSSGFVTAGASGIVAANPANGAFFVKAKASANIVGRTRQASGTAHDSGTLLVLADATDVTLTVKFFLGHNLQTSYGEWWVDDGVHAPVMTPFTTAQVTDVFNMIAGAASLSAQLGFAVNGVTQRNAVVQYAIAETDRP